MSLFRHTADFLHLATGEVPRRLRSMLSRRQIDNVESTGDRVRALGREALDGSYEDDTMDQFSPVGLIGRPADDAAVESLVAFVGADGSHPVSVSCLDGTRRAVIEQVGLEADEVIVYNTQSMVRILADGTVEIRSLTGTAQSLAFVDSVNARIDALEDKINANQDIFDNHTHLHGPYAAAPPPAGQAVPTQAPLPKQSAISTEPAQGTKRCKAE